MPEQARERTERKSGADNVVIGHCFNFKKTLRSAEKKSAVAFKKSAHDLNLKTQFTPQDYNVKL